MPRDVKRYRVEDDAMPVSSELNELSRRIIGAAIEVHSALGPGLLERMYEDALVHELQIQGLAVERQRPIALEYKGVRLEGLRLDLIVESRIIVELKAVDEVPDVYLSKLTSYLRAAKAPLGLLINFNVPRLIEGVYRRVNGAVRVPQRMEVKRQGP